MPQIKLNSQLSKKKKKKKSNVLVVLQILASPFLGCVLFPRSACCLHFQGPLGGAFGLRSKWKNRAEGAGSHFWPHDSPALNSDDPTGPSSLQARGREQPHYSRHPGPHPWRFPHPCQSPGNRLHSRPSTCSIWME